MSTLDTGLTLIRTAAGRVSAVNGWMGQTFKDWMPKGLYARALLIMIVPMVILQSVVAFVFMERHWNTVTRRLSAAVVQDVAALIDVYKGFPQDRDRTQLRRIAQQRLGLVVDFLPVGDMPPPVARMESIAFGPFVYHLDRGELRRGEDTIHLTDRERDLLRVLGSARGETVPRGELTGNGTVNERAVDVQINRLRRKIERDPANPLFVQTVRGIGYRLVVAP